MKMDIVVERIAANGQPDRRDVKTRRAIRIGMPERNTDELFSFEFENASHEFIGDHEGRIDCPGNRGSQYALDDRNRCLLSHDLNSLPRRNETRLRKSLLDCVHTKEMIAVAVSRIDRRQILAAAHDPIDKFQVLVDRDRRIHQHGITLA